MPFGGNQERIEANNQQPELKDKTYPAAIVDVWFKNVVEEERVSKRTGQKYTARIYTPDLTEEQDCEFKFALAKRPDIILSTTMRVYLGAKAQFAKFMDALGIAHDRRALEEYLMCGNEKLNVKDTSAKLRKDLTGTPVLIQTQKNDEGWIRIPSIMPQPAEDDEDDLASVPPQTNAALRASSPVADDGPSWDDLEGDVPF